MVGNDGEREFLYTSPLELLATVAETVSDQPTLLETCPRPNVEKDSSFERITAGRSNFYFLHLSIMHWHFLP